MDIQASGADTWLLLNGKPLYFHTEEDTMAEAIEDQRNTLQVTRYAPYDISISVDNEELQTYYSGRWDWYPKDYAGLYLLEVSAPGVKYPRNWFSVISWATKGDRMERESSSSTFSPLKKRAFIRVCCFVTRPCWILCGTEREDREGYSYYCSCYSLERSLS